MKSKTTYLVAGIITLLAQVATFVVELVFFIQGPYMDVLGIVNMICSLAAIVLTTCCLALTLCTKNEKTTYAIVIPTVVVNMFLNFKSFYSELEFLLWFVFRLLLVVGTIFYLVGLCSALRSEEGPKQEPQQNSLNQELQKLVAMKDEGIITEEEFDQLKMKFIMKDLK